jgi:glutaredoxin 3
MKFTVYSKPSCPQCDKAKDLLNKKGIQYDEVIVDVGQEKVEGVTYITAPELKAKIPTAKSVPQIVLDGTVIGGFPDLQKLIGT